MIAASIPLALELSGRSKAASDSLAHYQIQYLIIMNSQLYKKNPIIAIKFYDNGKEQDHLRGDYANQFTSTKPYITNIKYNLHCFFNNDTWNLWKRIYAQSETRCYIITCLKFLQNSKVGKESFTFSAWTFKAKSNQTGVFFMKYFSWMCPNSYIWDLLTWAPKKDATP